MKITVVLLGRASELAGTNIVELELPEGSKVRDLMKALGERVNPVLAERYFKGHYVFVVYVNGVAIDNPDTVLKDGDRVALITPEMGG
ncbi:MAG: MoaD/ThiS family protein [Desulfurococcaceae archaeon]